jgi:hypothetical protein
MTNISPGKKKQLKEIAVMFGELFGAILGSLIVDAITAGLFYAIVVWMLGLSVTYFQVFGAVLILGIIKEVFFANKNK